MLPTDDIAPKSVSSLGPGVIDALRQGRTIDAIKFLRTEKGIGLKEAKDIIDAHLRTISARTELNEAKGAARTAPREMNANPGPYSPGEVPRSRSFAWLVVVLVAAAVGIYYVLQG